MTPYYDENGIIIYHGDCRDVLPSIEPADVSLLLTDPPYGIEWSGPDTQNNLIGVKGTNNTAPVIGDDVNWWDVLEPYPRRVVFGANYLTTPPGGLLIWDKSGGGKAQSFMPDAEVAWTNVAKGCHVFHHLWKGAFRDYVDNEWKSHYRGLHPTQKPTRLMRWIVGKWTDTDDLVLDPFMGSGPVAQACYEMRRRYIGIEIEERYCEVAVDRLAQGVLEFS